MLKGLRQKVRFSWTFKITFLICVAVLLTAGVPAVMTFLREREVHTDNLRSKGWAVIHSITPLLSGALAADDQALLGKVVKNIKADGDVAYAAVLDTSGLPLVHSDPAKVGRREDDPLTLEALAAGKDHAGYYRDEQGRPVVLDLVAPLRAADGRLLGFLRVGMRMEAVQQQMLVVFTNAALVAAPIMLLGFLLTVFLLRHTLDRPVRELKAVTTQAAAADFSAIDLEKDWPDDLGELAQSLNLVKLQLGNLVQPLRDGLGEIRRAAAELLEACETNPEGSLPAGELRSTAKRLARLTERLHSLTLQIKV